MKKNLMLFIWFIKFGLFKATDEYSLHDYIRAYFCPEYIPSEEFDEKEQLLRDTPGPAGIKYAYYVGNKVNGISGAVFAILALLIPVVAAALALFFAYPYLMEVQIANIFIMQKVFNGMHAAVLGLILAQLYKIIYFNKVNRKSVIILLPAALIFIFVTAVLRDRGYYIVLMPFYIIAIIVIGVIMGFVHEAAVRYRIKHPKKYDPHSRKAIKMRDRQIREEEENMRRYIDDDAIKRRRQQLEEEAKNKKHKGEE